MATIHTRSHGTGRLDTRTEGPENLRAPIIDALRRSFQVLPLFERERFIECLAGYGVPTDEAARIADTVVIVDDALYLRD